jgi:hypothetical protein
VITNADEATIESSGNSKLDVASTRPGRKESQSLEDVARELDIIQIASWRTPWHWTRGTRVDPFNVIPWASDAPFEMDIRK